MSTSRVWNAPIGRGFPQRARRWRTILGAVCAAGLAMAATTCKDVGTTTLRALEREWTTTDIAGEEERVIFGNETVTWDYGGEKPQECPFRVGSYNEKAKTIEIRMKCKPRTGSEDWVIYRVQFTEDHREFTLTMEGRTVGKFRLVS